MTWLLLLFTLKAQAYIPEYSTIASRAADQHGQGTYEIQQEVIFRKDPEIYTVNETWLVNGENTLRVSLDGRGPLKGLVSGTIIYEGNSRIFFDGALKSQKLGDEWVEPFFHFRNSKYFRSRLVSLKVAPQESLRDRAALPTEGELRYSPPSFIRLSRVGGAIAWAIGLNPAQGESPTLWLEQDQFVVRKYKSPRSILHADDYSKFDDKFWYPRSRTYQYGAYTVQVRTLKVEPVSVKPATDSRFKGSSLAANKEVLRLPELDGLKDFYQRFR